MPVSQPILEPGDPTPTDPGTGGGGGGGSGGGGTTTPGTPAPTGLGTTIFDVTFPKESSGSYLRLLAVLNAASADDFQYTGYLSVDSGIAQVCPINLIFDNQNSQARGQFALHYIETALAAGTHRIVISVVNTEPDSPLTIKGRASLEITEIKPAAL